MKQTCKCGCDQPFRHGNNRKYATPECADRMKKARRKELREERSKKLREKLKVCCCGCGKQFKTGIAGRKYFNSACRTRMAVRKAKAKEPGVKIGECKICGAAFVPRNQRHVTCSPDCARKAKRQKDERRYKHRVPATHRPGSAVWDGIKRKDDWDHSKFMALKKKQKKLNGRTCMSEGCKAKCVGVNNYFCEFHKIENYRRATAHAFVEEGGSRQSAHMIFGG